MALTFKKEIEFHEDISGIPGKLHFCHIKGGKEIDFLVLQKNRNPRLIEVKLSDES